ncbi:type IV secretion system protein VirB10 [Alphaproteobacteria bacterium]
MKEGDNNKNLVDIQPSQQTESGGEVVLEQESGTAYQDNLVQEDVNESEQFKADITNSGHKSIKEVFSNITGNDRSKKVGIIIVVLAAITGVYFLFFSSSKSNKQSTTDKEKIAPTVPVTHSPSNIVMQPAPSPPPTLQSLPVLKAPEAPVPPPPPIPIAPPVPVFTAKKALPAVAMPNPTDLPIVADNTVDKQKIAEKMKAQIMVFGGGVDAGDGNATKDDNKDKTQKKDGASKKTVTNFLGFDNGMIDSDALDNSTTANVTATIVKNLDRTIVQGKVIDSVLETAINTDIPGILRAIVARDVYAEQGKNVLIPKGSRLIGSYSSDVAPGQNRVAIVWDRLIMPNGIDIQIGSPGADQLGRAGVSGNVDDKWMTKLSNAFLVSYMVPLTMGNLTNKDDKISVTVHTGGTTPDGKTTPSSTTTTGSAQAMAMQNATQQFQQIAGDTITQRFNLKPTITVDQGTKINIIVTKDLIFSSQIINKITQ